MSWHCTNCALSESGMRGVQEAEASEHADLPPWLAAAVVRGMGGVFSFLSEYV